jgi:S1-C subfamily serine protease/ribosomal protein L37AE/L43A
MVEERFTPRLPVGGPLTDEHQKALGLLQLQGWTEAEKAEEERILSDLAAAGFAEKQGKGYVPVRAPTQTDRVQVACPSCGKKGSLRTGFGVCRVKCRACGGTFVVPAPVRQTPEQLEGAVPDAGRKQAESPPPWSRDNAGNDKAETPNFLPEPGRQQEAHWPRAEPCVGPNVQEGQQAARSMSSLTPPPANPLQLPIWLVVGLGVAAVVVVALGTLGSARQKRPKGNSANSPSSGQTAAAEAPAHAPGPPNAGPQQGGVPDTSWLQGAPVGSWLQEQTPAPAGGVPLSAEAIFAQAAPAVVQVRTQNRQGRPLANGSGFLVSSIGLIATNYHVIKDAHAAQVVFADKTNVPVLGVAALDREADVAILKVAGPFSARPLELAESRLPAVGTKVYAIGNPEGLTQSLSDGLVSGHREHGPITEIQTTAPISPGSSGGPLLGPHGKVVGVTTAFRKVGQNLNFAVPASHVQRLRLRCEAEGKVARLPLLAEPAAGDDLIAVEPPPGIPQDHPAPPRPVKQERLSDATLAELYRRAEDAIPRPQGRGPGGAFLSRSLGRQMYAQRQAQVFSLFQQLVREEIQRRQKAD